MPTRLVQPPLFLIAKASHSALARQIEYLKTENEVLRAQAPKRLRITPQLTRYVSPMRQLSLHPDHKIAFQRNAVQPVTGS